MFKEKVTVKNTTGLHARPASQLVTLCQQYESDITIVDANNEIDPKSIISILSAGIKQGTTVELIVEGTDEREAGAAIIAYIESLID